MWMVPWGTGPRSFYSGPRLVCGRMRHKAFEKKNKQPPGKRYIEKKQGGAMFHLPCHIHEEELFWAIRIQCAVCLHHVSCALHSTPSSFITCHHWSHFTDEKIPYTGLPKASELVSGGAKTQAHDSGSELARSRPLCNTKPAALAPASQCRERDSLCRARLCWECGQREERHSHIYEASFQPKDTLNIFSGRWFPQYFLKS